MYFFNLWSTEFIATACGKLLTKLTFEQHTITFKKQKIALNFIKLPQNQYFITLKQSKIQPKYVYF